MKRCVIIGAGGFGKEVAWIIQRINACASLIELIGFCDDAPDKQEGPFGGSRLLGSVDRVAQKFGGVHFVCAIGNNRTREKITARAKASGLSPLTVVDPSSVVAPDAIVGDGSYIGIGSVLSAGVVLGEGVIVNHQACVGHDARLGRFSQVCPGARVSGGCEIGEGALLGSNAATIPLIKVGAWSVLGAGAAALRDIPDGASVVRLRG